MTENAQIDERRILRRVIKLMLGLTLAGAAVWSALRGLDGLRSFAAGAAISWLSFFLLYRLVTDVEKAALAGSKPHPLSIVIHAFRTLILGGAAYVILRVYEAHPPALVTGLLVTVSAAVVEALIEQTYAS